MRSPSAPVDPGFDVVVLGAGLNSLNLTIAFHAQYGMRRTTVVRTPVAMNERTVTTDLVTLGADASDEDLRDALIDLAAQRPAGRPALLLTNADSLIELIDRFRADLEPHYLLAQVDAQPLSRLADKAEFAEICEELGIDTVPTVIVDFSRAGEPDWNGHEEPPWSYPVVGKAANTAEYHHVDFPGKKKVFFLESAEEQRGPRAIPAGGRLHRALPVPGADRGGRHRAPLDHRLPLQPREGDAAVRGAGAAGRAHPRGARPARRDGHRRLPEPHRRRGALPGPCGLRGLRELRREGRPAHRPGVLLRDQPPHRPEQLLRHRRGRARGAARGRGPGARTRHRPGARHPADPLHDPAAAARALLCARSRPARARPRCGAARARATPSGTVLRACGCAPTRSSPA
ncbi:hypothetical protein [Brachybacterium sp. GPGPB12]|uniref:hypothetical protein n=1 Tax=Brachybacterium sp. GPGPB12 TaxID=3023517 RepID=UPI0031346505